MPFNKFLFAFKAAHIEHLIKKSPLILRTNFSVTGHLKNRDKIKNLAHVAIEVKFYRSASAPWFINLGMLQSRRLSEFFYTSKCCLASYSVLKL